MYLFIYIFTAKLSMFSVPHIIRHLQTVRVFNLEINCFSMTSVSTLIHR
jgi:hypothetical protein